MRISRGVACFLGLSVACTSHAVDSPLALTVVIEDACPSVVPPMDSQSALGVMALEGLASSLIGTVVDVAGAYFAGAATTKSVGFRGSANDTFYSMEPTGDLSLARGGSGCVVLFVPGNEASRPWFDAARQRSKSPALTRLVSLPQFYFEAAFERSASTAQTLKVRSQFLHITKFQETGWSYRDDRNYSVAITLRSREDGQPFGSLSFDYSAVRPGTRGDSQEIRKNAVGPSEVDPTIEASMNSVASSQRVAFFPITPDIEVAASAQKIVAAPYVKAARLKNNTSPEPVLLEPEWTVRSIRENTSVKKKNFMDKLGAYCDSLDGLIENGGNLPKDSRCPIAHLQSLNDLEYAKAELRAELESEWATGFVKVHAEECKKNAQGKIKCDPPEPRQKEFGAFAWEATVVETREPTAFATAVASAFASNKDKFKNQLQNELLPSKKEEGRQAAENAKRDALVTFRLAMLKVDEAEAKVVEAAGEPRSAQLVLQAEVLRAKVAANSAARAAGQPVPFDI